MPDGERIKILLDTQRDHQDSLPHEIRSGSVAAETKGQRHIIQIQDGWLLGLDEGEFGGALWWFSSDGKKSKKLADVNIVGFAKTAKGILALAGLAHMSTDVGSVLRVTEGEAGNHKIETLADLGTEPGPFAIESPDSLLILTMRGLVRVRTSGAVEQLFHTNYSLLYPNSMTLSQSGVIHIGMRHFVTRLTPAGNSYKEEWFAPADCSKFDISGYNCVCVSSRQ